MNTTQHTMHYSNNSTALRKDGTFGKAVAMALLAILLVVPATLRAQTNTGNTPQNDPEPAPTIHTVYNYASQTVTVTIDNPATLFDGQAYRLRCSHNSYGSTGSWTLTPPHYVSASEPEGAHYTGDVITDGGNIDFSNSQAGHPIIIRLFLVNTNGTADNDTPADSNEPDAYLDEVIIYTPRYSVPTVSFDATNHTVTITNDNTDYDDDENPVATTINYYTGSTQPASSTTSTEASVTIENFTTATEFHIWVTGEQQFPSYELVTTVDPTATAPTASVTSLYNNEEIRNNNNYTLTYTLIPPQTDGTVPTRETIEAATFTRDQTHTIAASGTLDVSNARENSVYKFAHFPVRTEVQKLGNATVSTHYVYEGTTPGTAATVTIFRYANPVVNPHYDLVAGQHIDFALATADQSTNARVLWKKSVSDYIPTSSSNSSTITSSDFTANTIYGFRTFGSVDGATKFPSYKGSTVVVNTGSYNAPAILNYSPYTSATDPASGTFVAANGSQVYINYNNFQSGNSGDLLDPLPNTSSTYNTTVLANQGFPESFSSTKFKIRASAVDPNVADPNKRYPSPVVTVDDSYSGYYVIHYYDATNDRHHYLSLDSLRHTLRDIDYFDHSCLWFLDNNNALVQYLQSTPWYLNASSSTLNSALSTSSTTSTPWTLDATTHRLKVANKVKSIPLSTTTTFFYLQYNSSAATGQLPWNCPNQSNDGSFFTDLNLGNTTDHPFLELAVIYTVNQLYAANGTFTELDQVTVNPIIVGTQTEAAYWTVLRDQSSVQLTATVSGRLQTHTIPPHYHYYFSPAPAQTIDFAFYPGSDNSVNRSYANHTLIPRLVADPAPVYFGSQASQGEQYTTTIDCQWRLYDGLVRHRDIYPDYTRALSWDNAEQQPLPDLLYDDQGNVLVDANDQPLLRGTYISSTATGAIPTVTATLNSAASRSATADTVVLRVTCTYTNRVGDQDFPVTVTAESRPLVVHYGSTDNAIHVRETQNNVLQNNGVYLIANTADRAASDYSEHHSTADRHFLTVVPQATENGSPEVRLARHDEDDPDYYRAFRFVRATDATEEPLSLNDNPVYRIYCIAMHDGNGNEMPLYSPYTTTDVFYRDQPQALFVGNPTQTGEDLFVLTPYKEYDGNNYILISPYNRASNTPGVALTPSAGAHDYDYEYTVSNAWLQNATLRIGNGYNSVQQYAISDQQSPVTHAMEGGYYYGSYWQIFTPELIPPEIQMAPDGTVTFVDHEAAEDNRNIPGTIMYALSAADGNFDQNPSFHEYTSSTSITLTQGMKIQYKKVPTTTGDYDYFRTSPTLTFTAHKMLAPTVSAAADNPRNIITFALPTNPAASDYAARPKGIHLRYTTNGTDPVVATSDSYTRLTPVNSNQTDFVATINNSANIKVCTFADNYLASDIATIPGGYLPTLLLDTTVVSGNTSSTITFTVPDVSSDQYTIYLTVDGSEPAPNVDNVINYTANFSSTGYQVMNNSEVILKAKAVPTNAERYRASETIHYYNWGTFLTFCHLTNPGATPEEHIANDERHRTTNYDYHMVRVQVQGDDVNRLYVDHDIDNTSFFRGSATVAHALFCGTTNKYLYFSINDGHLYVDAPTNNNPAPEWTWGGAPAYSYNTTTHEVTRDEEQESDYTLTTTVNETTYYLVYDDENNKWKAVTAAALATDASNQPPHLHKKVAFRTQIYQYNGGDEFTPRELHLQAQQPDGEWVDLNTDSKAWLAYSQNESVELRASISGLQIHYAPLIDINILHTQYDNGNSTDPDEFVPWMQWHRYNGQHFCRYHWQATPGYVETEIHDTIFVDSDANVDWNTVTFSLPTNAHFILSSVTHDLSRHHSHITLSRTTSTPADPTAALANLTVHYHHPYSYANNGHILDADVKVRLFPESKQPFSQPTYRQRFFSMADNSALLAVIPDETAALTLVDVEHPFLRDQMRVHTSSNYDRAAIWQFRLEPQTHSGYYLSNLLYDNSRYYLYSRPDYKGGLFLVDIDENTNLDLYHYNHPTNSAAHEEPFNSTGAIVFDCYKFNGYVALRHSTRTGSPWVYSLNDSWQSLYYGEATSITSTNPTDGDITTACIADFWSRRWKMEDAPLTAPDIALVDPSGTFTITHPRSDNNPNIEFYYKIINAGQPVPATLAASATTLIEGVTQFDPDDDNQVQEGQTVVATIKNTTTDENNNEQVYVCQEVNTFTPTRTPAPVFNADGTITAAEGCHITIGINKNLGETHWNSDENGFYTFNQSTVDVSDYLNHGHIVSAVAWRSDQVASHDVMYAHEQSQHLVINSYSLGAVDNSGGSPTRTATITATITVSSDLPPQAHYTDLFYTFDLNTNIVDEAQANDNTAIVKVTTIDPNYVVDGNSVTFTFTVTDPILANGDHHTIRFRVLPTGGNTFYLPSNQVDQLLINTNYNTPPTPVGNIYPIASAADYLAVYNLINNNSNATEAQTYAAANYKLTADIDLNGLPIGAINNFTGTFNGNYHVISNLTQPMFNECKGAKLYNIVIDHSAITDADVTHPYTGAICCIASNGTGTNSNVGTLIYNSGVRSTDNYSSVTGNGITGGLVGYLGGSSRVINCYNFADVTSTGNNAAGIVGEQQTASSKTNNQFNGIVFNCMNYGVVTAAGTNNIYPVIGGSVYTAVNDNFNTYNYFLFDESYENNISKVVRNDAFNAEERFLNRFEFYRYILNSNLKKCGWWVNGGTYGEYTNPYTATINEQQVTLYGDTIGKWVLDKSIAPYPVILPKYDENGVAYQYPSMVNPDYDADWRETANEWEGKKLGTLTVKISSGKGTYSQVTKALPITDMDTNNYDYNYRKIQLPYFQDIFGTGSCLRTKTDDGEDADYIVTGWKITAFKKDGEDSLGADLTENPVVNYNYADLDNARKDLWNATYNPERVFAQGGYYSVPYGVTEITIEAYWGKAYFLHHTDAYEGYHKSNYNTKTPKNSTSVIAANTMYGSPTQFQAYGKTVQTRNQKIGDALAALSDVGTVYDQAVVLLTDFSQFGGLAKNGKKYTIMTVDEDNDHEPDHCLYYAFSQRALHDPVRFDFLPVPELGMAGAMTNYGGTTNNKAWRFGIICPKGHFEITETSVMRFFQFEYDRYLASGYDVKVAAPLILNGGVFEQMVSGQDGDGTVRDKTSYIQLGGHVWFKLFAPGIHPDRNAPTKHCPVSVLGGDYDEFYLTGYLRTVTYVSSGDVEFHAVGGRLGNYASGGNEKIDGIVTVKADHIYVPGNFFGGGINPTYPITEDISITINNSILKGVYAGGPAFGDMQSQKRVTTHARNTRFNTYYGAGYGGTSRSRSGTYINNMYDSDNYDFSSAIGNYTKGKYNTYKTATGIAIDYAFEMFPGSSSYQHVPRFYIFTATLSKAQTNDVESDLVGCTIDGNYYGGGFVGKVTGTAKSKLENCTIYGDVFAGGNKAEAPKAMVYDMQSQKPFYNGGVYFHVDDKPAPVEYSWVTMTGSYSNNTSYINTNTKEIKTPLDLSDMGMCTKTDLTIDGNTVVYGSVYGGGNEAETGDPNVAEETPTNPGKRNPYATVVVKGNAHVMGDVVGAGKKGKLTGSTSLTIGAANGSTDLDEIPWVEGDIYGGADSADVDGYSNVTIYDGILGPVYGGGFTGSVYKESNVTVLGGRIGYSKDTVGTGNNKTVVANPIEIPVGEPHTYFGVFGAGFGFGTSVGKDSHVQIGSSTEQHTDIYINGSVFGGGEAGQVGTGFEIWHGETVPNQTGRFWHVDGPAGTYTAVSTSTSNARDEYSFYAQFYKPTFSTTTVSIQAPNKAEGSLTTNIAGAVFGGGRGYYITEDEEHPGTYSSTQNVFKLAIAGAVYGSTEVTIGSANQGENGINIGSVSYYTDRDKAEEYQVVDLEKMNSGAGFWDEDLFVYDVEHLKYVKLDPNSTSRCRVQTRNGSTEVSLWHNTMYDDVVYYVNTGRASVVGGGEMGPVYGDGIFTCGTKKGKNGQDTVDTQNLISFNYKDNNGNYLTRFGTTDTTGNTKVTIYSGTIGDVREGLVNGCVYGGGLRADVDGTSRVDIDGTHAWVRGDVYAGGCMGSVYGYHRDNATEEATTTTQYLKKGWVRNAHGGSNLAEHGTGCNSLLVVGETNGTDANLLVSESVYGANGFSPSDGTSAVEVKSGKIGFVKAGYPINIADDPTTTDTNESDARPIPDGETGHVVVPNVQDNLAYEGCVYGGGFGVDARVKSTTVSVSGGIIRSGVFGGGELAAVYTPAISGTAYKHSVYNESGEEVETVTYYTPQSDPLTVVNISGGQMSMVCGGGRGYSNFLKEMGTTPGAIMGSTQVNITGGTINSDNYSADFGGGNVYGGGLEGIVTGDAVVSVSGNASISGHVFAGGRGFSGKLFDISAAAASQTINDRSSRHAGWVLGNTSLTVANTTITEPAATHVPTIGLGVYGGGEGFIYNSTVSGKTLRDTVANVHGHAIVNLTGGFLGGGYKFGHIAERGSFAGGRIASVHGYANMLVSGEADVSAVYGGNDITGKVIGYGRPTAYAATANGTSGPDTTHTSFMTGGQNSTNVLLTSDMTSAYVRVTGSGAKVGYVYGGGNGKYEYYTAPEYKHLNLGNGPVQPSTYVDLATNGGEILYAFGGGNKANVNDAQIFYHGTGFVENLFAGGNSATATHSATVKFIATGDAVGRPAEESSSAPQHSPALENDGEGAGESTTPTPVHVESIFGGNNHATMEILPFVDLQNGYVAKVYGGGNRGAMTGNQSVLTKIDGSTPVKDVFDLPVRNLGTYLFLNNGNVHVTEALFGGCNNADVTNTAFVDVRAGNYNQIFGGNDVSADVNTTRIDMLGGTVSQLFGGGNGHYNYTQVTNILYNVYTIDGNTEVAKNTLGRPYVFQTNVNIYGGTVEADIIGGGYAGDCCNTYVCINDQAENNGIRVGTTINETTYPGGNAHITGSIFGGGFGDETLIRSGQTPHVGNVTGTHNGNNYTSLARTDLYSVKNLEGAKAYGGGSSGDVDNAEINVYSSWTHHLDALYGGCWGGNVTGTTTVNMYCTEDNDYNVRELYGGNDFSGTVNNSVVNVYGGKYLDIFGAGDGAYTGYSTTLEGVHLPNSLRPVINFYDGRVDGNLYGGGNQGLCFVGDTSVNYANAHYNADDYAHVVVNIHGGTFNGDVFAGAKGDETIRYPLIYGLKQINMDGGTIESSLYGGSESVKDGYYSECKSHRNTTTGPFDATLSTMRPSTIINIVGGTVKHNVYGAGYLGVVHGSVFVNIGREAVNTSPVWTNTYNNNAGAYATYKPTLLTYDSQEQPTGSTLKPTNLNLWQSVYGGANWGEGGGLFQFSTPGFFGGENRILIDGQDYHTATGVSDNPSMNIIYSLIGSGTSCEGGDINSDITVRNYGVNNGCTVTKQLYSIQRADHVLLQNTAFELLGDQDAYSAYASTKYSFNRIDDIKLRDYNTLFLATAAINIGSFGFEKTTTTGVVPTTAAEVYTLLPSTSPCMVACYNIPTLVNPTNSPYSLIYIKDGVYIDVKDTAGVFGPVTGYGILMPENNTRAVVTARYKDASHNNTDGGFIGACRDKNTTTVNGNIPVSNPEHDYHNYNLYRSWIFGDAQASSSRHVTIVAHADVTKIPENKLFNATHHANGSTGTTTTDYLAVTRVTLELPPTTNGSYYTIRDGITTDEDGYVNLVQGAFLPSNYNSISCNSEEQLNNRVSGAWNCLTDDNSSNHAQYNPIDIADQIFNYPNSRFGLIITDGGTFHTVNTQGDNVADCPTITVNCNTTATIAMNSHFSATDGYTTSKVYTSGYEVPKLDLYLTYSTNFSSTANGDIHFILKEYDSNNNHVGDINVTVTIATVLEKFRDQKLEVLAMHNELDNHTFTQKIVLPASLQRRELYLTDIRWEPFDAGDDSKFKLTGIPNTPSDLWLANNPTPNLFALKVAPTEQISASLTSTLGWYTKSDSVDVFAVAKKKNTNNNANTQAYLYDKPSDSYSNRKGSPAVNDSVGIWEYTTELHQGSTEVYDTTITNKGMKLGVLDGRSAAALNVTLFFNGDCVYPVSDTIGRAILGFDYYSSGEKVGHFNSTVYIRTRKQGDTIYMASASSLTRNGITIYPWHQAPAGTNPDPSENAVQTAGWNNDNKGKEPRQYLQTFKEVFLDLNEHNKTVYQLGDVICILDNVSIGGNINNTIHGSDYSNIPVVRYSGNHYQFPGADCAYGGPMITVKEQGRLSVDNMIFDGSMVAKQKEVFPSPQTIGENAITGDSYSWKLNPSDETTYYSYAEYGWIPVHMEAQGPIFEVKDDGHLTLGQNTLIQNNYNNYNGTGTGMPGGAIYLHKTNSYSFTVGEGNEQITITSDNPNPQLTFNNTVNIRHILVNAAANTGAVHVDGGIMELGTAKAGTKITIDSNCIAGTGTGNYYTQLPASGTPVRYKVNTAVFGGTNAWNKANVYLTRKASTVANANTYLSDDQNDCIHLSASSQVAAKTRIGVTKEFPDNRDTIQIARVDGTRDQYAELVKINGNFYDDRNGTTGYNNTNLFYHSTIDPITDYFQRCATFKKQVEGELTYNLYDGNGTLVSLTDPDSAQQQSLTYSYYQYSACPDAADAVTFRVHGGFYPYTYTWSWGENRNDMKSVSETTRYSNVQVNNALLTSDFSKARESNRSTQPVNGETRSNKVFHYTAAATDLAGCRLYKDYDIKMVFNDVDATTTGEPLYPASGNIVKLADDEEESAFNDYKWSNTNPSYTATATRRYKGMTLNAEVQPVSSWGTVTASASFVSGGSVNIVDGSTLLCPGDTVQLNAESESGYRFIQWDFDPYDNSRTMLVMPNNLVGQKTIMAYFSPTEYWKDHVESEPEGFTTNYYGSVHIYNENELAWLISLCNGLHYQQIHSFFFDTVFIHDADHNGKNEYDMNEYLWTPMGSYQNPFRGHVIADPKVTIKGIIVNEPEMDNVGFFGYIEDANINGLNISNSIFRGAQYVGGIAASARNSKINNSSVIDETGQTTSSTDSEPAAEDEPETTTTTPATSHTVTIITSNYASGALVGVDTNTSFDKCTAKAKFMGATIYNGGVVGYHYGEDISNSNVDGDFRAPSIYTGGLAGYVNSPQQTESGETEGGETQGKSGHRARLTNNYVRYASQGTNSSRSGGLVGYAKNTTIQNNYVYGTNKSATTSGAVAAMLSTGVHVENCFYEQGFDSKAFGYHSVLDSTGVTSFSGSGTEVILTDTLGSNANLTRQLNKWVYAHGGGNLNYWHSDTGDVNNGYPVFGEPEYQSFVETREVTTCDRYTVEGILCTESGSYQYHAVDSAEFTDTLVTLHLTLNYSEFTELTDTVATGEDYDGNGFHLDAAEIELMRQALQQEGTVTVVVSDTLQTLAGCDSVVTLYLTVSALGIDNSQLSTLNSQLKVYPNPTTKYVTVEGTGLQEVEVYDAVSRKLSTLDAQRSTPVRVDLDGMPAGAYYLRIRTEHGVVIEKVIKR